ncbi:hypothetical protein GTQ99_02625 [Kineococcus sp. T13]|uniref:hypothetical protein n=1 Tax=Kineococcus vitellinus TaxID=2696565 RepID=UPI0014134D6A|nr:hypothetical protein [Kineococcus vitellinus]NAZ74321.1 hypothetical protein [Kineococcus vitellinus]
MTSPATPTPFSSNQTSPTDPIANTFDTCVVFMLGYPGTGKRTVGGQLAQQLGGVLVDNALINRPLLELFQWDGVALLPPAIWDYVVPIRDAVLRTIEDLAPPTNSYVFTNVIEDGPTAAATYDTLRSLAHRRGSLFLAVMLSCEIEEQVSRIDNPDRVALRKGCDPEGYRAYTLTTPLYQPPPTEVLHLDTTQTAPADNARRVLDELHSRGFVGGMGAGPS